MKPLLLLAFAAAIFAQDPKPVPAGGAPGSGTVHNGGAFETLGVKSLQGPMALPADERAAIESMRRQILQFQIEIERLQPKLDAAVKESIAKHGCAQLTNELFCVPAPPPKKGEKK